MGLEPTICKYCGKEMSHEYTEYERKAVCNCEGARKETELNDIKRETELALKDRSIDLMKHIFGSQLGAEIIKLVTEKIDLENKIEKLKAQTGITEEEINKYLDTLI